MPRSRFLFSRFTILVKTVLKKVACRKQNPKKSKNRQPPKYNFICILILLMPNIVFSRVIFFEQFRMNRAQVLHVILLKDHTLAHLFQIARGMIIYTGNFLFIW